MPPRLVRAAAHVLARGWPGCCSRYGMVKDKPVVQAPTMTMKQLLEAYVEARLDRRVEEMERLHREIDARRARGESA